MWKKIIKFLFGEKPIIANIQLKEEIEKVPEKTELKNVEIPTIEGPKNKKTILVDRNYHHYTITDHAQLRMQERKISYSDINLAFDYGKLTDKAKNTDPNVYSLELNITDIPKKQLKELENRQIKSLTKRCPITLIVDLKNKIIKTVYQNNYTNFKEKLISDYVCKSKNNKYTKRIKGKLIDEEKHKKKLIKKLRPYKEIDDPNDF